MFLQNPPFVVSRGHDAAEAAPSAITAAKAEAQAVDAFASEARRHQGHEGPVPQQAQHSPSVRLPGVAAVQEGGDDDSRHDGAYDTSPSYVRRTSHHVLLRAFLGT